MELDEKIDCVFAAVRYELHHATKKFGPIASQHEGYAVILEELDELWQEIKHGMTGGARDEAIQVAAMAVRFLIDVGGDDDDD